MRGKGKREAAESLRDSAAFDLVHQESVCYSIHSWVRILFCLASASPGHEAYQTSESRAENQ